MMNTPKKMHTQLLRTKIDDAINSILPYFKVTEKELTRFKKPKIKRILDSSKYPKDNKNMPGYSFHENFFYFPLENRTYCNIFSQLLINHEVGHYIHNFVNPHVVEGIHIFLKTGKEPPGHRELSELVAEYSIFILDLRDDPIYNFIRSEFKEVYYQYGPKFLPYLARMNVKEATKDGVIRV